MGNVLKVNVSVISQKGTVVSDNKDEFYLNGKFTSEGQTNSIQASFENKGVEFVFAVSDKLTLKSKKEGSALSMVKSLRKYHEKIAINSGDMEFRIVELKSRIEEVSRLADSMMDIPMVGKKEEERENESIDSDSTGFSGVILTEGQIAALTLGTSKAFLMREGVFKPLTVDYAKTKRLLELGIITDEEAELYSNKFGSRSNNIDEVQISDVLDIREGDKILLCTDGLTDYVEDERIEDLLSMRSDSAYIANMLLSEAKKSGAKDDVTIMVIRVDQADASMPVKKTNNIQRTNMVSYREKNKDSEVKIPSFKYSKKDLKKYEGLLQIILVVLTAALLIAMVVWMVSMMNKNARKDNNKDVDRDAIVSPVPLESDDEETQQSTEDKSTDGEVPTLNEGSGEATSSETSNADSSEGIKKYIIIAGDNMRQISIKEYGTVEYYKKLAKYNNKTNYNDIKIGEELLLPSKEVLDGIEITDEDFKISPTPVATPVPSQTTGVSSQQGTEGNSSEAQTNDATESATSDIDSTAEISTEESVNTTETTDGTDSTQ